MSSILVMSSLFRGGIVAEVKQDFHDSIDDYLEFCKSLGESPDKPFSCQFITRISPDLHRQLNVAAHLSGMSLNAWVTEQLKDAVRRSGVDQSVNDKLVNKYTQGKTKVLSKKAGHQNANKPNLVTIRTQH